MAKKTVKAVTRLQKFLAAIAGDCGAPEPITDFEKLLYNIAEAVNSAEATETPKDGGTPEVENPTT